MGQEEAAKAVNKVERDEGREVEDKEGEEEERCDFCGEAKPLVYCRADAARLCLSCDRQVHTANTVCSRHPRSLLCDSCRAAASSIFCPSHRRLLCSNCDFDAHRGGGVVHQDRRPVESFSGCPTAAELVGVLGVGGDVKSVVEGTGDDGGDGWLVDEEWMWETPPVFSLDDLIVPTTSCHGFHAIGIPPLPKNRNSTCGQHKEEIVRQLHELIKSEIHVIDDHEELEQVLTFQTLVPQQNFQLGNLGSDFDHDGTCTDVPACEDNTLQWKNSDCQETTDTLATVFPYEQYIGDSSVVNLLTVDEAIDNQANANEASFADSQANANGVADNDTGHTVIRPHLPSLPLKSGNELAFVNRDSVISRYKEKRKTRRYDKLIRYESRKIRADRRIRIKGRFAKTNQVTQLEKDQKRKLGD